MRYGKDVTKFWKKKTPWRTSATLCVVNESRRPGCSAGICDSRDSPARYCFADALMLVKARTASRPTHAFTTRSKARLSPANDKHHNGAIGDAEWQLRVSRLTYANCTSCKDCRHDAAHTENGACVRIECRHGCCWLSECLYAYLCRRPCERHWCERVTTIRLLQKNNTYITTDTQSDRKCGIHLWTNRSNAAHGNSPSFTTCHIRDKVCALRLASRSCRAKTVPPWACFMCAASWNPLNEHTAAEVELYKTKSLEGDHVLWNAHC